MKVRDELAGWRVQIGANPITLPGRVLPMESVQFGDGRGGLRGFAADRKADFTLAFRSTFLF